MDTIEYIVKKSTSYSDVARFLGKHSNGRGLKLAKKLTAGYDVSHFGSKLIKYLWITKNCPICSKSFETQSGHSKERVVCSAYCSNFYHGMKTEATRKKISDIMKNKVAHNIDNLLCGKNKIPDISCTYCSKSFHPKSKTSKFCSRRCCGLFHNRNDDYRNKLRDAQFKLIKNGTHVGWKSRSKLEPSYPEKFFMKVLKNNNIEYEHDKHVGKYFIDFAFEGKMIALEIDGKQHLKEERKQSDHQKDKFLKSVGWTVYRIPWKSINTESGKQYIKNEIDKFLEFYRAVA